MKYIDEKFKDESPEITVKKIADKLAAHGIVLNEKWNNSEIENCQSCRVSIEGGDPGTNGKGITPELARASAYGEFIERLQSGLFFYKYQSFEDDPSVYLHSFAPDKKYVNKDELLEDSDWMEPICKAFNITKLTIAEASAIFNGSDRIITLPYYSLFEDKYVYLPAMFVEHIYGANGCCVGNTREEAWVHALSEIFERNSSMSVLKSGKPVPIIPREKLKKFNTVNKILEQIENEGIYEVDVLDFSCGKKFPVVATRIINKETKGYLVNVGADPVFEIAVERTLTEIFQGRNLKNFTSMHYGKVLSNVNEIKTIDNVFNQVETGNGLFTVDFFAGTDEPDDTDSFVDNTNKTNKELLKYVLSIYRELGLNIYVRNNSFLGFHCYKFIVPGYSDIKGDRLKAPILDYYFASKAAKTLKNLKKSTVSEMSELLLYRTMIDGLISRVNSFRRTVGLPLIDMPKNLIVISYAYAALKTNNIKLFDLFIDGAIQWSNDSNQKDYLSAVKQWVDFKNKNIPKEKVLSTLCKFYKNETLEKLKHNIDNDILLDEYLFECNDNCASCKFRMSCNKERIREMIKSVGEEYAKFVNGQDKENFIFN